MSTIRDYKDICNKYPLLSRVIRNAFMSSVTYRFQRNKNNDMNEAINALNKLKKNKRTPVIKVFNRIVSDTNEFTDVIPNVVTFFNEINNK